MRKIIVSAAAMLLCILLLCGCSGGTDVTVSVQSVSMITGGGSVGLYDRYAGVIEAGDSFSIEKDPDMQIKERLVSAGDEVKEGDVLFTYDTEAVALELEKKELELEQLNASITTKTAQMEQLEKEKNRVPASEQLDYTLQIQELQVDISEAKLNVTAKEKEIERFRVLLENAEVLSPVEGRVQTVNENGGTDENGNPLPYMSIAQTGALRVKGAINEQSVGSLQEGTRVVIRSRIDSSLTWNGTVERVDWDNPISNNNMGYGVAEEFTGSTKYPFHITLDSDEGLMLGQHVYIEPDVGEQQTGLMLPAFYINDAETSPWVWAENGRERLEKRSLTLGSFDEVQGTWEVLDGLTEEDYIAFPDETCVQGAKTIRYDEGSFGGDNGEDGGIGAYDENAVDGGFAEGDFAGKSDDGVIFDDAEAGIDWEAEGEAGAAG